MWYENVWIRHLSSWTALLLNIIPILTFFSIVSGNGGSLGWVFTLLVLAILTSIFAIYVNWRKSKLNIGAAIMACSIAIGITLFIAAIASVADLSQIT